MLTERRMEALARAYPGITFRPPSRGLLARLMRAPAECAHLETDVSWMATFVPDTVYLRGKARRAEDARPEVSLCHACLTEALLPVAKAYRGRVVAFEPDPAGTTQCFFLDEQDFQAAGLRPETADAIGRRLATQAVDCEHERCSRVATWLWLTRAEVGSLDNHDDIASARGRSLCAVHGAEQLCRALGQIADANLLYVNAPYGNRGAYLWI